MTAYDYGVEYTSDSGTYITAGWDEKAAHAFVKDHGDRSWRPTPTRVMRRVVGEWEPVTER